MMLTDADVSLYNVRRLPIIATRATGFAECQGCGSCCKGYPGLYVPEDFGEDIERMAKAIRDGVAQVDRWDFTEDDTLGEVYFLRAPTRKSQGRVIDFTWGGACALLRADGCSLQYEARPRNCRGLVPAKTDGERDCREDTLAGERIEKRDYVATWEPFSGQVAALARRISREVGQ
jgi:Fe-S-cluster containining protein